MLFSAKILLSALVLSCTCQIVNAYQEDSAAYRKLNGTSVPGADYEKNFIYIDGMDHYQIVVDKEVLDWVIEKLKQAGLTK